MRRATLVSGIDVWLWLCRVRRRSALRAHPHLAAGRVGGARDEVGGPFYDPLACVCVRASDGLPSFTDVIDVTVPSPPSIM